MGIQKARQLRRNQTDAEKKLWQVVRGRQLNNWKFRRQEPVGRYIVDFICHEAKLIIELDGGQHLESTGDIERTKWLESKGFRVLRFWDHEVLKKIEAVEQVIWNNLTSPSPGLSHQGRGGNDNG